MRIKSAGDMLDRIEESHRYIREPYGLKGKWNKYFGNDNPIHAEFGSGRGDFITGSSVMYPEINFIGLEKYKIVLARAAGKLELVKAANTALIVDDIINVNRIFDRGEIERIYLNFLDPWPKKRHEKRRVTNEKHIAVYKEILDTGGTIHLKTDNTGFFHYSLECLISSGFVIEFKTEDLYSSQQVEGNIKTEYETRFANEGISIKKIIARR